MSSAAQPFGFLGFTSSPNPGAKGHRPLDSANIDDCSRCSLKFGMPSDISLKARACITAEYAKLCSVVGLHPLPLDIYVHEKNSNELTPSKTKRGNATPLYVETIIVLPVADLA